ncbi:MAG: CRISPR system precrRNA processing endoribonuclease RAMP protein Cas6 [Campylobacterota bacterium]|nr:CRISPR system precrRNA processing endoribonuclease RAMP protein Cas6 [Campylobacterota bacterium]
MKYVKLSIIIKDTPNYFIGSELRGALGYALKKVTCINPSFKCDGCFSTSNCLYYQFYEEKNIFHKFRFDFELGKEYYDFSFYLFEDVIDKLPYIVSAFHMMLTQNGLGFQRKKYKDFDIYINDEPCIENGQINLPKDFIKNLSIDKIGQNISLNFVTPLRIKKENRFVRGDNLELKDIVNSIYQREMKLLDKGHQRFPYEIKGEIVKKDIFYQELTRRSNRQKTTMNLGGIMGSMEIKGIGKECYEVLKVGELIGVGKSTVFGLGKIKILDKEN